MSIRRETTGKLGLVTFHDAPGPPTRRSVRRAHSLDTGTGSGAPSSTPLSITASPLADSGADATTDATAVLVGRSTTTLPATNAPGQTTAGHRALGWIDEQAIARTPLPLPTLAAAASPYVPVGPALLANPPRRSLWRAGVVVPVATIALLVGAYSATTLLWPLHAVAPVIEAAQVNPVAAPPATLTWPGVGSASVSVAGISGVVASAADSVEMASITKLVTALVVLDAMPLAVGEQGPEYRFTYGDSSDYWSYRENGESALDVPVDGVLTEYQLLEGMLIGSANNYADRLARNLWPTDEVFANAANTWLAAHGVPGVTVVEPTGLDPRNTASPEAVIGLAKKAMADPVIAEIVAKHSVELPGAELVENTNGLLADPGVVGIKTGSLDYYNLVSAKDIVVGDATVRVYAAVMGQPDDESRLAASRTLYAEVEQSLQPVPSVTAGTVVGQVTTEWGESVAIRTDTDASVILWNGAVGTVATDLALKDAWEKGTDVGSLEVTGPLGGADTEVSLADDIDPPSPWWRLTHPLDLFGLS